MLSMNWLNSLFDPESLSGWDLLWAVLSGVAGWVASIFVARSMGKLLSKTPNMTETLSAALVRTVKYSIVLLGVGIGLSFLGASMHPIIAITIIIAVVMVLALRGIAENFAAGIVLQTRHPVKLHDELEIDGIVGTITELNARSIVLHTTDGRTVHVPNGKLLSDPIVNHSERGARRSKVQVRIPTGPDPLPPILAMLEQAASEVPGIHTREPAHAIAIAIGPDRTIIEVRFWHHPLKSAPRTSDVTIALADALREAGILGVVTSDPGIPPYIVPDRM